MARQERQTKETMRELSEIFVETLKEMAGSGERLAPQSIAKSLSNNPRLNSLLSREGGPVTKKSGLTGDLDVLEKQLAKISGQRDALSTKLKVTETQANRKSDLLTRAVLTVLRLINPDDHPHLTAPLADFRQAILAGEDSLNLEERLRLLKETILRGSPPAETSGKEQPQAKPGAGLLGRFFGRSRQDAPHPGEAENEVWVCTSGDPTREIKEIYLELLAEFQVDLGPDYLGKLHELMRRVNEADDPDYLLTLRTEVAALLRSYVHKVGAERAEAAQFITELLQRLAVLYEQVMASQKQNEANEAADDQFAANLSGQIEAVVAGVAASQGLDELRAMILARMGDFRTVLQEKSLEDQVRRRKIKKIMLAMRDEVMAARGEVTRMQQQNLSLQMKLLTDPLTGVYNRRALRERLDEAFAKAKSGAQVFSLAMCDLDNFKLVNDNYGHSIGDELLKEIAKRLGPQLREADTLARFGGDEFVVLLPGAGLEEAAMIAEKLKDVIAGVDFQFRGKHLPITLSVGVGQYQPEDAAVREVLDRADKALYQAKAAGRNQVAKG